MQHPQHRIAHHHCLDPHVDVALPRNNARTVARTPARQPALPSA
ncbi:MULTISPECIES: hypothetical protein [Cupriavidus]|nr:MULTISPECIES: hypothetical protein [Cupriavidus]MEC3768616.1 hypothetical protein [Cupriavidus sp. SS-3]